MPSQRLRVLIVDDDNRVLNALRETVAGEADLLVVASAGDAASALGLLRAADPQVALVDVLLPEAAAGLALISTLSRSRCAVVAMSVRSTLRAAALHAGAVGFVDKGDDIEAMLRSIRAAGARTA